MARPTTQADETTNEMLRATEMALGEIGVRTQAMDARAQNRRKIRVFGVTSLGTVRCAWHVDESSGSP